jgi:hypothetical protein
MLTVKLVEHNGHEQIHEVKQVWSTPNPERDQIEGPHGACRVSATKNNDEVLSFSDYGVLYVMNEGGQTIAKYWLGYGQDASGLTGKKDAA